MQFSVAEIIQILKNVGVLDIEWQPRTAIPESTFPIEFVEEMLQIVGVDVECGTCMEIAFTGGSSGHNHECKGA